MDTTPALNSMTCNSCGKKIAEVKLEKGIVSIICPKCGTVNIQETKPTSSVKNANS